MKKLTLSLLLALSFGLQANPAQMSMTTQMQMIEEKQLEPLAEMMRNKVQQQAHTIELMNAVSPNSRLLKQMRNIQSAMIEELEQLHDTIKDAQSGRHSLEDLKNYFKTFSNNLMGHMKNFYEVQQKADMH